jgi:hypothetical protein
MNATARRTIVRKVILHDGGYTVLFISTNVYTCFDGYFMVIGGWFLSIVNCLHVGDTDERKSRIALLSIEHVHSASLSNRRAGLSWVKSFLIFGFVGYRQMLIIYFEYVPKRISNKLRAAITRTNTRQRTLNATNLPKLSKWYSHRIADLSIHSITLFHVVKMGWVPTFRV